MRAGISIMLILLALVAGCVRNVGEEMDEVPAPAVAAAQEKNDEAVAHHLESRLKDARQLYAQVLELDPPLRPTSGELELVKRYAPLLYTTPTEPLPLKDVVVIIHPDRPLIAYHLFWEDDIDFPDDSEPCDHEEVWVSYAPEGGQVTGV